MPYLLNSYFGRDEERGSESRDNKEKGEGEQDVLFETTPRSLGAFNEPCTRLACRS